MKQYMRKRELCEEFGFSMAHAEKLLAGIRKNMGTDKRYSPMAILGSGKSQSIRTVVFMDWLKYSEYIGKKEYDDILPPFDPLKLERECGILQIDAVPETEMVHIDTEALAKGVIAELVKFFASAV